MVRKKLALTFNYTENWIAGTYYLISIIKALNALADEGKPILYLLLKNKEGRNLIEEINYPYLHFLNINANNDSFPSRQIRKVVRKFFGKDLLLRLKLKGVRSIFEGNDQFPFIKNHFYWVHDFQELRLPDFFTPEESADRSSLPARVSKMKNATIIVSSFDALNDFKTFFKGYVCNVKTLRFASSLPKFDEVNFKEKSKEYNIDKPYFICSNQFWQHKNHIVVLEAVKMLRERNLEFLVVFTGKNYDHRNSNYFSDLVLFAKNNGLDPWIRFCGFLDRKVQLSFAAQSMSYIQPSLFEGWSTTVEDAKYLNQYVLLSDIPVHREQLSYNVSFFNPSEPAELASKMEEVLKGHLKPERRDYQQNIIDYGNDIVQTFLRDE
jgi:glycosyltransferase involved in cell wall biosynthesis